MPLNQSRQRFSLPFPVDQINEQLAAAYAAGVAARGGKCAMDENTSARINKVATWLTSTSAKPMLMLCGNVGTGKTEMARAIQTVINSMIEAALKQERELGSLATSNQMDQEQARVFNHIIRLPRPALVGAQQIAEMAKQEDDGYMKARRRSFLIVDDLGAEPVGVKVFGSDVYPLIELITYRYDEMLPTVYTTNLTPDGVRSYYGERVADRLKEACALIPYPGGSYRK